MGDPTYVRAEIESRPEWKLAWLMSEWDNDNAPIGWGRYIVLALRLLHRLKRSGMDESEIFNRLCPEASPPEDTVPDQNTGD